MRYPFAAWLWWMSDDLNVPPELRLNPMPATAGVALIDPDVVNARELLFGTIQQQRAGGKFTAPVEKARAALGTASFDAAWTEGRAMTPEQAVAYALGQPTASS